LTAVPPPALLRAPRLPGAAEIGVALAVDPGLWSGAASLAFQWRRDGADIEGARARVYVPRPEDDGCELACAVAAVAAPGPQDGATEPAPAVAVALAGPARAAWPAPRLRRPLPEEVFDEGEGAARVETAGAFEGARLVFALAAAPPGARIDPATGALDLPRDRPLAFGLARVTATNSGGTAEADLVYVVEPAPPLRPMPRPLPLGGDPAPGGGDLPPVPPAALAEAMGLALLAYDAAAFGSAANGRPKSAHSIVLVALAAHAGATMRVAGRTPADYMRDQIALWAGAGLPWAQGGVSGQRDFPFLCAAALARRTPAVWDRLTATEREKLARAVEAQLVSLAWQMADANPFVAGSASGSASGARRRERTLRGGEWGRGRVPNFTLPAMLGPPIAADFLGGPVAAEAFLDGFGRAAFLAALEAADRDPPGALAELRATFGRDWGAGGGRPGPRADELEAALRDFTWDGLRLSRPDAIAARALRRMWGARIRPGVELDVDARLPKGYAVPPPGTVGIFEPAAIAGAPNRAPGRDALVGRIPDLADWARWEEADLADLEGAATELFTRDGGAPGTGSGSGPRSAMSYAHEGASVALCGIATLAALGLLDRADPDLRAGLVRQGRGVADLELRNRHGHRSFAKAGRPWAGLGTNEDWDGSLVAPWRLGLLYDLWHEVLAPWAG